MLFKYSDDQINALKEIIIDHPASSKDGMAEARKLPFFAHISQAALESLYSRQKLKIFPSTREKRKNKKSKNEIAIIPKKDISIKNPHRRPNAPVSLALQFAELAVSRLTYDEKLLLAKTILDSES